MIENHKGSISCENVCNLKIQGFSISQGVRFHIQTPMGETSLPDDDRGELQGELHYPLEKCDAISLSTSQAFRDKKVVLLDDDVLVHRKWKRRYPDLCFISYFSLENCVQEIDSIPWDGISAVVCDVYFSRGGLQDVELFLKKLRRLYEGPVFLASSSCENLVPMDESLDIVMMPNKFFSLDHI